MVSENAAELKKWEITLAMTAVLTSSAGCVPDLACQCLR